MAVLILMPEKKRGGAERQFNYLLQGLINKGQRVYVLYTEAYKETLEDHEYIISFSPLFLINEMRLLRKIRILKKSLRIKETIVYDKYGHYLIPFLKMMGLVVLFSERNSGQHKNPIGRLCISRANIITTNSAEAANTMKKYVKKKTIHYIPNGIVVDDVKKQQKQSLEKPIKVCIPARIDRVKNQLFVIKALETVEAVEVHIAGKITDNDYYDEIMKYIQTNNLEKKVVFDGFISDMKEYYSYFDMVILPSLSEGTPNIILESYANKILCMQSNISMNKSIAISEDQLFDPHDEDSLKYAFTKLVKREYIYRAELIERAYTFVKQEYSIERMVDSYYALMGI